MRYFLLLALIACVSCRKAEYVSFDGQIEYYRDVIPDTIPGYNIYAFFAPNGFTPNGDGVNDELLVLANGIDNDHFNMTIYNRYGNQVFKTNNVSYGWNGNQGNTPAPQDLYQVEVSIVDNMGNAHDYVIGVYLAR
ncbi:MAG TPA: gliding motility-associated C-terminal domain-containing protein [Bacteroidia bacterium]|nr:gliding motility-associated C-terminal domain-containing protein [Bacteroidia bacterium]